MQRCGSAVSFAWEPMMADGFGTELTQREWSRAAGPGGAASGAAASGGLPDAEDEVSSAGDLTPVQARALGGSPLGRRGTIGPGGER
jgi:sugar (pentulose or hexulose) kinase